MYYVMLVVLIVYVVGMVWAYYSDKKKDETSRALLEHKLRKLDNVYSFVEFVNDSNKIHTSEFFTAELIWDDILFSSEDKAKEYLDKCFKRGYFQTDDGICIPVSQVKHAKVITKLGV